MKISVLTQRQINLILDAKIRKNNKQIFDIFDRMRRRIADLERSLQ